MIQDFTHPRVSVAIAIRREGRILLHKRAGTQAGYWGFPGGKLELWETFEGAVLREVAEEAGPQIKITKPKVWTVENTPFPNERTHFIVVLMVADWIEGEPMVMESTKNEGWYWFPWDHLPDPLMMGIRLAREQGLDPWQV